MSLLQVSLSVFTIVQQRGLCCSFWLPPQSCSPPLALYTEPAGPSEPGHFERLIPTSPSQRADMIVHDASIQDTAVPINLQPSDVVCQPVQAHVRCFSLCLTCVRARALSPPSIPLAQRTPSVSPPQLQSLLLPLVRLHWLTRARALCRLQAPLSPSVSPPPRSPRSSSAHTAATRC